MSLYDSIVVPSEKNSYYYFFHYINFVNHCCNNVYNRRQHIFRYAALKSWLKMSTNPQEIICKGFRL